MNEEQKKHLLKIITTIVLLVILHIVKIPEPYRTILYFVTYLFIGFDILKEALESVVEGHVLDENFLMVVATIGVIALAIYEKSGDYAEAIYVMLFYRVGEFFEEFAVDKSRNNILTLMDIRPDYANIEIDGVLNKVDPHTVNIGDVITINPGEKVPIDGIVIEGSSELNKSALTGESSPKKVEEGNTIFSGSINISGVLKVKTTKNFEESTASKIIKLVEDNEQNKSKSENFISRFAKIYTPVVCISALVLVIIPPIISYFILGDSHLTEWIYKALIFLAISCPCALVISIPLSFFAGLGCASKEGILIKGSNHLENLSKTKIMVFDKTGTLTKGVFEVDDVHHGTMENEKIIEYAAICESPSSHPISRSLQKAYGKKIDISRLSNAKEYPGEGMVGSIDGKEFICGNEKLMKRFDILYIDCHEVGTIVHCALDGDYVGHILIRDVLKPNSKEAIQKIKDVGVEKVMMLTGDDEKVGNAIAECLNMDEVYSELLPIDKVNIVKDLMAKKDAQSLLTFVGDGMNDAPSLVTADIGIAMGAIGSDAAIEASDIVLMDDDPLKISRGIKISKKCLRIVYENIVFSIGVKLLCLILSFVGVSNMYLAVFADVGVMIIAVINALRALIPPRE